jgi:ABC-type sugar transport system permease subunit
MCPAGKLNPCRTPRTASGMPVALNVAHPAIKAKIRPTASTVRLRRPPDFVLALPWILPGLILFFVFVHLPMLVQVVMSFGPDQLGKAFSFSLRNYADLMADGKFWAALGHNIQYAVASVIGKIALSFVLALALNGAFRGRAFFRAVFFLPVVISFVAVGTVWGFMLQYDHGAVNVALRALHLPAPNWLGDPHLAMWSIILVDIWKWTGFHVVIYLAGLQALPHEVEEAAIVDGASPWQRLWHITVPLMAPYTITNVIIATLGAFSVFDLVFVMTTGGPFNATQVAMTQVYLNAFQFQRFGYASAEATVLLAIMGLVSVFLLRLGQKAEER